MTKKTKRTVSESKQLIAFLRSQRNVVPKLRPWERQYLECYLSPTGHLRAPKLRRSLVRRKAQRKHA